MKRVNAIADRTMRGAALVVTDRRWAATMSAMALGFGLFIGVAIGPGAEGGLATPAAQIVELPTSSRGMSDASGGGAVAAAPAPGGPGGGEAAEAPLETAHHAPFSEPSEPAPLVEPAPPAQPTKPAPEPAPEEEEKGQTLGGVVVHTNPAAGSYALAIKGGELVAVHAPNLPAAGTKLSLPVRRLANGTFAEEEKPERQGRASKASFTGTVTFLEPDPAAPAYTVSGRGVSVLVRVRPDPSGAAPALPPLGAFATVEATIEKPTAEPAPVPAPCEVPPGPPPPFPAPASVLWQRKLEVEDVEPSTYLELAGVVSGFCVDRPSLLLSADDARNGDRDLLLTLSPKVDARKLRLGDSVLAGAEVAADGSLTLTGTAGDEHTKGADDPHSAQGDLARR